MSAILVDLGGSYVRVALAGDELTATLPYAEKVGLVEAEALAHGQRPLEFAIRSAMERRGLPEPGQWPKHLLLSLPCDPGDGEWTFETLGDSWTTRREDFGKWFRLDQVRPMNDFEAIAWSIHPLKHQGHVLPIGTRGQPVNGGRMVVLGPGTALGAVGLVPERESDFCLPIRTEFGHAQARLEPEEARILRKIRLESRSAKTVTKRVYGISSDDRLSVQYRREYLTSGPGIVRMYHVLMPPERRADVVESRAIVQRAKAHIDGGAGDPAAAHVIHLFCRLLGKHAAELAATFTARGMVFLVGPIVNEIGASHLERFGFREVFDNWLERKDGFPAQVPTVLVTHPHVGLLGLKRLAKEIEDAEKKRKV